MELGLKDALGGLLNEIGSLWRTLVVGTVVFGLFAIGLYAWLVGIDVSVINESSRDLSGVQLVDYTMEGDRRRHWAEDLDRGEREWRYIFTNARGVAVQFELDGKLIRQDCDFDSKGIGRSVELRIQPNAEVWCIPTAGRV